MARGSKASYSNKQKRQAKHIEDSTKKSGRSAKTAARIAWATVNKLTKKAKGRKKSPTQKNLSHGKRSYAHYHSSAHT